MDGVNSFTCYCDAGYEGADCATGKLGYFTRKFKKCVVFILN